MCHIPLNAIRKCVPGIFSLTYLRNYGAAFSFCRISSGSSVITLAVVGAACYFVKILMVFLVLVWTIVDYFKEVSVILSTVCDLVTLLWLLDFMNFAILMWRIVFNSWGSDFIYRPMERGGKWN